MANLQELIKIRSNQCNLKNPTSKNSLTHPNHIFDFCCVTVTGAYGGQLKCGLPLPYDTLLVILWSNEPFRHPLLWPFSRTDIYMRKSRHIGLPHTNTLQIQIHYKYKYTQLLIQKFHFMLRYCHKYRYTSNRYNRVHNKYTQLSTPMFRDILVLLAFHPCIAFQHDTNHNYFLLVLEWSTPN